MDGYFRDIDTKMGGDTASTGLVRGGLCAALPDPDCVHERGLDWAGARGMVRCSTVS